jgi:hypothetical protein
VKRSRTIEPPQHTPAGPPRAAAASRGLVHAVRALQHAAGNRAVTALTAPPRPVVAVPADLPDAVRNVVVHDSGRPLDTATRTELESSSGQSFGDVRIHAGTEAGKSARAIGARAYTVGHHVVLDAERYPPQSPRGRAVLAHELAHVLQQGRGGPPPHQAAGGLHEREAQSWETEGRGPVLHGTAVGLAASTDPSPTPLTFPPQQIEMPYVGSGAPNTTEKGYLRDQAHFWREYRKKWPDHLSPANRTSIANGRPPVVDDTWIRANAQHARYRGETLIHHHIGQGGRAVAIPEGLHRAHSLLHPQRQTVGRGGRAPLKELKPLPTPERTQAEVERHVREGRVRGVDPATAKPPPVPLASELAGLSEQERRPVSPKERADLARVDPKTGQVRGTAPPPGPATPTRRPPAAPAGTTALAKTPPAAVPQAAATPGVSPRTAVAGRIGGLAGAVVLNIVTDRFRRHMVEEMARMPAPKIDRRGAAEYLADPDTRRSVEVYDVLAKNFTPFTEALIEHHEKLRGAVIVELGLLALSSLTAEDRGEWLRAINDEVDVYIRQLLTVEDNVRALLALERRALESAAGAEDLRRLLDRPVIANELLKIGFGLEDLVSIHTNLGTFAGRVRRTFSDARALDGALQRMIPEADHVASRVNRYYWSEILQAVEAHTRAAP